MKKYLIALLALAFHGCQKEEAVPPCITISGFTPSVGLAGTVVTISGANFSTSASQNAVTFNGINGTVTNVSATSLTVNVPVIATTGSISVTTNEHTATTSAVFTVVGQETRCWILVLRVVQPEGQSQSQATILIRDRPLIL